MRWSGAIQLPFTSGGGAALVALTSAQLVYGKWPRPLVWQAQVVIDPTGLDPTEAGTFQIEIDTTVGCGSQSAVVPKRYTLAPTYQVITDTGFTVADSIQAQWKFTGFPSAVAGTVEPGVKVFMSIAPVFHEPALLQEHADTCDAAMIRMVELLEVLVGGGR
jgi:hypothetical protein